MVGNISKPFISIAGKTSMGPGTGQVQGPLVEISYLDFFNVLHIKNKMALLRTFSLKGFLVNKNGSYICSFVFRPYLIVCIQSSMFDLI